MPLRCTPVHRVRIAGLTLGAICFFMAGGVPATAQEDAAVGQVVQQKGPVTALRAGVPRSLYIGAFLQSGDRIRTGAAAKVRIDFRDGSSLSLGENTDVELSAYLPEGSGRGVLTLLLGIIRTSLSSVWRDGFEVRTLAAVASVRSTDWITELNQSRASVFVVDGSVAVRGVGDDSEVVLEKGFGVDVEAGKAPPAPKEWGAARVEQALARTRVP